MTGSNCTSRRTSSRIDRSPRAGVPLERLVRDRAERVVGEVELDPVEAEKAVELLREGVARLGQDRDQILPGELVDRRDDRQPADELRDEAVLHQVSRQHHLEDLAGVLCGAALHRGTEANAAVADAAFDHAIEVGERAAADKRMFVVSIVGNSWCGCLRPP